MAVVAPERTSSSPAPACVSARLQAKRVLVLARLLTVVSLVLGAVTYSMLETIERVFAVDIWLDQRLLNWQLYAVGFLFWTAVFAAARRYLRLDTRP